MFSRANRESHQDVGLASISIGSVGPARRLRLLVFSARDDTSTGLGSGLIFIRLRRFSSRSQAQARAAQSLASQSGLVAISCRRSCISMSCEI